MDWINVKDRLPPKEDYYLSWAGGEVRYFYYKNDGGVHYWNHQHPEKHWLRKDEPITHWMPLPEPPINNKER